MALSPAITNPTNTRTLNDINAMHWSQHIDSSYQIINLAQPGGSNLLTLYNLKKGIIEHRPSAILLGFTSFDRIEVPVSDKAKKDGIGWKYITGNNIKWFTDSQREFYQRYVTEYPMELKHINEYALIEYTVMLARAHAPTCHTMNLATESHKFLSKYHQPFVFNAWDTQLPINLIDGEHWRIDDHDQGSFHVKDPNHHRLFADQINRWLLTI